MGAFGPRERVCDDAQAHDSRLGQGGVPWSTIAKRWFKDLIRSSVTRRMIALGCPQNTERENVAAPGSTNRATIAPRTLPLPIEGQSGRGPDFCCHAI